MAKQRQARRAPLVAYELVDCTAGLPARSRPLAFGVGAEGEVLVVAGAGEELGAQSLREQATTYTVMQVGAGERRRVEIEERLVPHHVQPTARGFLLVSARCRWRPQGPELNAAEYDWGGSLLNRFTLGDGIQDVRVDGSGSMWVSYFDEGIFGNFGWNSPGPECLGARGLVRFDAAGKPCFHYSAVEAGTDDICDAYAINASADGAVWVYFYTEFPIVRILDGTYRTWACGLGGAQAIAIDDSRALLFGDYDVHHLARVVHLGNDGRATCERELVVQDEAGLPIVGARAFGVGKRLYLMNRDKILMVENW